jgi:hypothetical protein
MYTDWEGGKAENRALGTQSSSSVPLARRSCLPVAKRKTRLLHFFSFIILLHSFFPSTLPSSPSYKSFSDLFIWIPIVLDISYERFSSPHTTLTVKLTHTNPQHTSCLTAVVVTVAPAAAAVAATVVVVATAGKLSRSCLTRVFADPT